MTVATLMLMSILTMAQMQNPVHFSVIQKQVSPSEVDVIFTGRIDKGWHVYSTGLPDDGPISATLTTETANGAKATGKLKAQGNEINQWDEMFGMKLRYFENSVTFVQRYKLTGGKYHVKGFLEYGACNDQNCLPPTQVEFDYTGKPTPSPSRKEGRLTITLTLNLTLTISHQPSAINLSPSTPRLCGRL